MTDDLPDLPPPTVLVCAWCEAPVDSAGLRCFDLALSPSGKSTRCCMDCAKKLEDSALQQLAYRGELKDLHLHLTVPDFMLIAESLFAVLDRSRCDCIDDDKRPEINVLLGKVLALIKGRGVK